MTEMQIFKSSEFGEVRTLEIDGFPYFVGKDVATVLGYSNTRDALAKRVDEEDKDGVAIYDPMGRKQVVTVINESGLYSLILSSKLVTAKKFKRWVTNEVLPAIRQHGVYATDGFIKKSIEDPTWAISVLQELQAKKELVAVQQQVISELQPKATYYDLILQNNSTLPITKIAKDYGMSGRKLNALLHELGVQYRMGKTWLLYQEHADKGYTQSRTFAIDNEKSALHTYWTQKGRLFLYDLLKSEKGILPVIERGEAND
ncbi:phage antirepressor [Enterococcus faecium]|uniref:phage antirepressor n=1 Tax=Enterococcus faecium TaxID=1352 RepID=UPI003CE4C7A4